jgi:hypothetical protein
MSMLNLRRDRAEKVLAAESKMPMPKAANVAPPPPRQYSPEALNFAQRLVDDQVEIERLKLDADNWRSRALASEEQVKRLEMQIDRDRQDFERELARVTDRGDRELAKRAAQHDNDVNKLTDERDFFKLEFNRIVERHRVAAKVILDTLTADAPQQEKKRPPEVNLNAIAEAIEAPQNDKPETAEPGQ